MDKPLEDPVLEAAAQIVLVFAPRINWGLASVRLWAELCPSYARDLLEEATRQIDALRAAGHIPEKTNDQT